MPVTVEEIMKSAKHLTAGQMARIANRYTPGRNWSGSPKGRIAEGVAPFVHDGGIRFRVEDKAGRFGVTPADLPVLKAKVAGFDARDAADRKKVAELKAAGRQDFYGILNPMMLRQTEVRQWKAALAFAEKAAAGVE